jgi:hypothetical protein
MTGAVKGPGPYFPTIEKAHGQPVSRWLALIAAMEGLPHMQRVARLKAEHGLGHGHANALVAHALAVQSRP